MVVKKNPEELPEEVVDFQEVFSDINTPEYWIAKTDEDLKSSLIVLDGHSTVLVYQKETEELNWEAIHEIGQYEYTPDNIGDGLVIFPHTFYFEFDIELTGKELHVSANFDGTGIKAIVMPFKDVDISSFIGDLKARFSSVFSSVLKPKDDSLVIEEGKELVLPDSMLSNLGIKLAMMGVNLQKINVLSVTTLDIAEGEMVEEVFEVPVEEEEVEKEEAAPKEERKRKKKSAPPSRKIPPPKTQPGPTSGASKPASAPAPSSGSTSAPPAPSKPAPPPPAKSSSAPRSASPAPPPSPTSKPVSIDTEKKSPATIPSPPGGGQSTDDTASISPVDDIDTMEDEAAEMAPPSSSDLYAKGMKEIEESPVSLKHTHASWFERMIPNRAYPLVITISSEEVKVRKSVTRVTTGEKQSEKTDTMIVEEDHEVIIKPEFPGCMVVPQSQVVDIREDKVDAKFHVTPLALGQLDARVVFEQNNKIVHYMELETKVIKHRVSRWSAAIGSAIGILPAVVAFFLGRTPQEIVETGLESWNLTAIASLGYIIPAGLMTALFGIGGVAYMLNQPSSREKSASFPR